MLFYTLLAVFLFTAPSAASAFPGSICTDCECRKITNSTLVINKCKPQLSITSTTFKNISRKDGIHVVSIDGAFIQSISADAFTDFTNLQDVIIKNTNIGTVDPNALAKVTKVSFTNCAFEDEPNLYSSYMEELKFTQCRLTSVPRLDLDKLIILNLTNNNISNVDIMAFSKLQDIEEIDLSSNEIESFPANVFVNNKELNTLTMDNNPLKEFVINTTNNIEFISVKGCKIRSFERRSTRFLNNVYELYLADNEIENIKGINMALMNELQIFDISNNKLNVLQPDVFENNTKLEKIFLDGNPLEYLPIFVPAYDKNFKTYMFSCQNCQLKNTISPFVFQSMSALFELRLSNNHLTNIDDSFGKISSLITLDVSNNNIISIGEKAFSKNVRLENLYISGNSLTTLNVDAFANLHNLILIEADNNSLTNIWTNKNNKTIKTLKSLNVRNNKLKLISTKELEVTPNLDRLAVNGNELDCDHNLISMIAWLSTKEVRPPEVTHMEMINSWGLKNSLVEGSLWRELATERCQDMPEALDQIDNAIDDIYTTDKNDGLENFETDNTNTDLKYDSAKPVTKNQNTIDYDEYYYYYDDENSTDERDDSTIKPIMASIEEVETVRYASYIFSLTTVFILTALFVLFVAVTIILLILRKNGAINMQTANIPRFKIPTWSQTTGIKKHSGSIYRPLSEDIYVSNPEFKKYEFSTTPIVHSNQGI